MSRLPKIRNSKRIRTGGGRIIALVVFFLLAGATLVAQLFRIQVLHHRVYSKEGEEQYVVSRTVLPKRGEFFWRDISEDAFVPLVVNEPVYDFYIVPSRVEDAPSFTRVIGSAFLVDEALISSKLTDRADPYELIRSGIGDEEKRKVSEQLQNVQAPVGAYGFEESFRRSHIDSGLASHVTGFFGFGGDGEGRRGQYGVEEYFDADLAGISGRTISDTDVKGRPIPVGERSVVLPKHGKDIVLTLDKNIQYKACAFLAEYVKKYEAAGGAVVAMEPQTGNIYALCGEPHFDPNRYGEYAVSSFVNPVTGAAYEPGSIFKPITMAAALDGRGITPFTTFIDTGSVVIGNYVIRNAAGRVYGRNSMVQVLDKSINTGAIFAMRSIGPENFRKYVEAFGFGRLTGIEIASEVDGDVRPLAGGEEIYAATASFGQGITATPIQLVSAYAAIARGGVLVKPRLVDRLIDGDEARVLPVLEGDRVISKEAAESVALMLVSAVKNGYAKRAGVSGYAIAGKTGTAEVPKTDGPGYTDDTIHSFVGFGPVESGREAVFVMLVKLDKPRGVLFADSTAAPLFHDIAEFILHYLNVPTSV